VDEADHRSVALRDDDRRVVAPEPPERLLDHGTVGLGHRRGVAPRRGAELDQARYELEHRVAIRRRRRAEGDLGAIRTIHAGDCIACFGS
jgi:hypothetical protein